MDELKIAVTSKSFSKNEKLRKELLSQYSNVKFNDDGKELEGEELVENAGDGEEAFAEELVGVVLGVEDEVGARRVFGFAGERGGHFLNKFLFVVCEKTLF